MDVFLSSFEGYTWEMQLYKVLSMNVVAAWREEEYQHEAFPTIAEIIDHARQPDAHGFRLRAAIEGAGISDGAFARADYDLDSLLETIQNDTDFVKEFKLEAVRETLILDYPSYILAWQWEQGKRF